MRAQVVVEDPVAVDAGRGGMLSDWVSRGWACMSRAPRGLTWALVLAYYGFIWWLSSHEGRSGERAFLWIYLFNGGHAVLFGLMAFLLAWCVPETVGRRTGRRAALSVVAAAGVLGIIDEIHQSTSPGRDASVLDFCTDLSGALFVIFLLRSIQFGVPSDRRLCMIGLMGGFLFPLIESRDAF